MADFTVTGDWTALLPGAVLAATARFKLLGETAVVPPDVPASVVAGVLKRPSGTTGLLLPAPDGGVVVTGSAGGPYTVTFAGPLAGTNVAQMTATSSLTGGSPSIAVATTTAGGSGVDEVQTVTISGGPTGGTFTLTFNGQTTAAIPYNATALQVQAALQALSNVGTGAAKFYSAYFTNMSLDGQSVTPARFLFQAKPAGSTVNLATLYPNLAAVA